MWCRHCNAESMQRIGCGGPSFCDHGKSLLRNCDECVVAKRFEIIYECVTCPARIKLTYNAKLDWDWPLIVGWSVAALLFLLHLIR